MESASIFSKFLLLARQKDRRLEKSILRVTQPSLAGTVAELGNNVELNPIACQRNKQGDF
jgi:hypothetical protein